MRFSELYANLIKGWPEEISISDAQPPSESGQYFPTLSRVNDAIEEQIDFANDNWSSIGHWALFQAFHAEAKRLYCQGEVTLKTRAVPLESINARIIENLKGEDWENERANYDPV